MDRGPHAPARRNRVAAFGALLAGLALLASCPAAAGGEKPDLRDRVRALQVENRLLERRLELASGDAFYLVLDPERGTLSLMLKGAVLQVFTVRGMEIGTPRIAFVSRDLPDEWRGRIWTNGNLEPPRELDRMEIVPPDPAEGEDATASTLIPPTPEEKYPVPRRYLVRYAGGLSLEVRPEGEGDTAERAGFFSGIAAAVGAWWHDLASALRPAPLDRIRIRLQLASQDGDSLYRALPPDTSLLVLPEDSDPG